MTWDRMVAPEWLDELPPQDPRAIGSRRDLRRLNFWMRNASAMLPVLRDFFPGAAPQRIAELGAGDGTFILPLARLLGRSWPGAKVSLVDRRPSVSAQTRRAIEEAGWRVEVVTADALEWLPSQTSLDLALANLFLHHFEVEPLARLLGLISQSSSALVACEPQRCASSLAMSRMLWLIGCNGVTRHDALISVRAGFRARELSAAWAAPRWSLREERAGLFTHLFAARKLSS
jgi:SAM-dependent methyltransferase